MPIVWSQGHALHSSRTLPCFLFQSFTFCGYIIEMVALYHDWNTQDLGTICTMYMLRCVYIFMLYSVSPPLRSSHVYLGDDIIFLCGESYHTAWSLRYDTWLLSICYQVGYLYLSHYTVTTHSLKKANAKRTLELVDWWIAYLGIILVCICSDLTFFWLFVCIFVYFWSKHYTFHTVCTCTSFDIEMLLIGG